MIFTGGDQMNIGSISGRNVFYPAFNRVKTVQPSTIMEEDTGGPLTANYFGEKEGEHAIASIGFPGGKNYSTGVAHKENDGMNNQIWVDSSDGGKVQTNNLYNSFRAIIEAQILNHPEVTVYNLSEHGAKISGTVVKKL